MALQMVSAGESIDQREYLIDAIAQRLGQSQHVAVGASSPIPAAAALLAQSRNSKLKVSLLGDEKNSSFTDGGKELFDCAAQGRIDTFFLSGVQIDGAANINLVGIGEYHAMRHRFAGSFGSAYLYHLVPNVILFCWSHQPEVLVEQVDFISAAGPAQDGCYRPGGPAALVTNRCIFDYDAQNRGFSLNQLFPGESVASVTANTGFEFANPHGQDLDIVQAPDDATLKNMRSELAAKLRSNYPVFVDSVWPDSV